MSQSLWTLHNKDVLLNQHWKAKGHGLLILLASLNNQILGFFFCVSSTVERKKLAVTVQFARKKIADISRGKRNWNTWHEMRRKNLQFLHSNSSRICPLREGVTHSFLTIAGHLWFAVLQFKNLQPCHSHYQDNLPLDTVSTVTVISITFPKVSQLDRKYRKIAFLLYKNLK